MKKQQQKQQQTKTNKTYINYDKMKIAQILYIDESKW